MKRKFLYIFSLFFASLLLVNVAGATWSLSSSYGNWHTLYHDEWKTYSDEDNYGAVFTNDNVNIATSWVFALSLAGNTWTNWYAIFFEHTVYHNFIINMTNLDETVSIKITSWFTRSTFSAGTLQYSGYMEYLNMTTGEYERIGEFQFPHQQLIAFPEYSRWYFFKNSDTQLNVKIVMLLNRNDYKRIGATPLFDMNFTVSSGWFNSVDLSQEIIKDGWGEIEGFKEDETFDVYSSPFEEEAESVDYLKALWESVTSPIYNLLPDWAKAIVDIFSGIGAIFVNTILPNLAVLLGAYLVVNIGLGFQSLSENVVEADELGLSSFKDIVLESFRPLYDLFLWIVNFLVTVAQIIAELLPF